jgi:hypothetical protein
MSDAPHNTAPTGAEAAAAPPSIRVRNLRKHHQNTLRGFCTVEHASGLVLHEVGLHTDGQHACASVPARPMIDADGRVMTDEHGRRRWQDVVGFRNAKIRHAWSAQVIAAVSRASSDWFADDARTVGDGGAP